jgi:signal transduction histidine kinase
MELITRSIILTIIAIGFLFAFWVYFNNKNNKVNKIFFFLTIFAIIWIVFSYLGNVAKAEQLSLVFKRLNFAALAPFFISAYFFSIYFPKESKRYSIIDKLIIVLGLILFFVSAFSNLVVKNIELESWGVNIVGGKLFPIFSLILTIFTIIIFINLIRKYLISSEEEKIKIEYLIAGAFTFAFFNLIFNIFFPIFYKTYQYDWIGDYSIIFFIVFTAYAIIKQKLFGIKVILTQILVAIIAILLFSQILESNNTLEYVWKTATFIAFIFLGYYLIRSVLREIKLREQLENTYAELKKLDMAKSEFMSITSHQLRTPLTAIKGYISMILDGSYGPVPSKMKGKIINVYESSERLIRLVNDLLSVSRIEAGKIELHLQPSSLEDIITSVLDVLTLSAKNKKLYLKWEKPESRLPKLEIDQDKIREVILNLVDNAIKYTQKGGITIRAENKGGFLLLKISDTGAGLSEEEMKKIFKSFSRGSAGNEYFTEGVGLGLYIARQFVDLHKGRIWAESEGKNKGTTFCIELQIKPKEQIEDMMRKF